MSQIKSQIIAMTESRPGESVTSYEVRILKSELAVRRHMCALTIKALALNSSAAQDVTQKMFQEGPGSWLAAGVVFLLRHTNKISEARALEEDLQKSKIAQGMGSNLMLDKKGDHTRYETISHWSQVLTRELNNIDPKGREAVAFLVAVDKSRALGMTCEDWTLKEWANEFKSYAAQTPRGAHPVITGIFKHEQARNFSVADARRQNPDAAIVQERSHQVSLQSNGIGNRAAVAQFIFENNNDAARQATIRARSVETAQNVLVPANGAVKIDTSYLDNAGLVP